MTRHSDPFTCGTPEMQLKMCDPVAEMEAEYIRQSPSGRITITRLDMARWIKALRFQQSQWDKTIRSLSNGTTKISGTESEGDGLPSREPGTSGGSASST